MRSLEANKKPVNTSTIVVASKPLRFGNELTAAAAARSRVARKSLPAGAFAKIADVAQGRQARRAHRDRAERAGAEQQDHRPGPARHAVGDAARRPEGRDHPRQRHRRRRRLRAAGRSRRRRADAPGRQDQRLAPRSCCRTSACWRSTRSPTSALDKPAVVKAVTLEVDVVGAQKLSLAASVGSLSLMLRKAGEANSQYTRKITLERSRRAVDADGGADRSGRRHHRRRCGGRRRARNTACRSKARICTRPATGIAEPR